MGVGGGGTAEARDRSVAFPCCAERSTDGTFAGKIYGDVSRYVFGVRQSWHELRDFLRAERRPSSRSVRVLNLVDFLNGPDEVKRVRRDKFFEEQRGTTGGGTLRETIRGSWSGCGSTRRGAYRSNRA